MKPDAFIAFYTTQDLDACSWFYGSVLGCPLVLDQGKCRIWRVSRGGYVGFCLGPVECPPGVIITLVTPRVDEYYRRLLAAGVTVEKPPTYHEEFKIYHLFCRDPNGYRVEVQEFRDPRWTSAEP